jgi:biofilm PGA synthesis protein PgaD
MLTALVWLVYLSLMSDAFIFIWKLMRWLFGEQAEPKEFSHAIALLGTIASNAIVIAINAAIIVAWAIYNQVRFRGRERRQFAPAVSLKDLSRMYGFPEAEVTRWQSARILRAHLDDHGKLVDMEVVSPAKPTC